MTEESKKRGIQHEENWLMEFVKRENPEGSDRRFLFSS